MNHISNSPASHLKDNSSLNLAYTDNFFARLDDLKINHEWKHLLLLGEEALLSRNHHMMQRLELHLELSKVCDPLGEANIGLEHAHKAFDLAQYLDDPNQKMQSLTLISRHQRALALQEKDSFKQEELFKTAKQSAFRALDYLPQCNETSIIAETFYQGGCACTKTTKADWATAMHWFREAIKRFTELKDHDGYYKSAIAIASLCLQNSKMKSSKQLIDAIIFNELSDQNKLLYHELLTQYYLSVEKPTDAYEHFQQAKNLADQLEICTFSFTWRPLIEKLDQHSKAYVTSVEQKV